MMRGKIIAALAATLLTITAGVLAQSSGFPSRPKFQAVGVGTAAPSTGGTIRAQHAGTSNGQLQAQGTASGVANVAYLEFLDGSGTAMGYVGDGGAANSDLFLSAYSAGSNVHLVAGVGGNAYVGNGTTAPVLTGKVAYGRISSAGVLQAGSLGVTSASRLGAGNYSVNYTAAGFASAPTCVYSGQGTVFATGDSVPSTTLVQYFTVSAGGAFTDSVSSFYCVGL